MNLLRSYMRCIFPLNVLMLNTSDRTLVLSYFFPNPAQSLFSAIIILGKFFDGQNYWSQSVCWWGGEVVFEVTTNTLIGQFRKYKMCNKLDKSKNFVHTQLQMQCNLTSVILFPSFHVFCFLGRCQKTHWGGRGGWKSINLRNSLFENWTLQTSEGCQN